MKGVCKGLGRLLDQNLRWPAEQLEPSWKLMLVRKHARARSTAPQPMGSSQDGGPGPRQGYMEERPVGLVGLTPCLERHGEAQAMYGLHCLWRSSQ